MPYFKTSQEWLDQSIDLLEARPATVHPPTVLISRGASLTTKPSRPASPQNTRSAQRPRAPTTQQRRPSPRAAASFSRRTTPSAAWPSSTAPQRPQRCPASCTPPSAAWGGAWPPSPTCPRWRWRTLVRRSRRSSSRPRRHNNRLRRKVEVVVERRRRRARNEVVKC